MENQNIWSSSKCDFIDYSGESSLELEDKNTNYRRQVVGLNLRSRLGTIFEVEEDKDSVIDKETGRTSSPISKGCESFSQYLKRVAFQNFPCAQNISTEKESVTLSDLLGKCNVTTKSIVDTAEHSLTLSSLGDTRKISVDGNVTPMYSRGTVEGKNRHSPPPNKKNPNWTMARGAEDKTGAQGSSHAVVNVPDPFLNRGARPKVINRRVRKHKPYHEQEQEDLLHQTSRYAPQPSRTPLTPCNTAPITGSEMGTWNGVFRSSKLMDLFTRSKDSQKTSSTRSVADTRPNTNVQPPVDKSLMLTNAEYLNVLPSKSMHPKGCGVEAPSVPASTTTALHKLIKPPPSYAEHIITTNKFDPSFQSKEIMMSNLSIHSNMSFVLPHPVSKLSIKDVPVEKAFVSRQHSVIYSRTSSRVTRKSNSSLPSTSCPCRKLDNSARFAEEARLKKKDCEVSRNPKHDCNGCPFKKCLAVGMKPELVYEDQKMFRRRSTAFRAITIQNMSPITMVIGLHDIYMAFFQKKVLDNKIPFQVDIRTDNKKVFEFFLGMMSKSFEIIISFIAAMPGFQELEIDMRLIIKSSLVALFVMQIIHNDYLHNDNILIPDGSLVNIHEYLSPFKDFVKDLDTVKKQYEGHAIDFTTSLILRAVIALQERKNMKKSNEAKQLYAIVLEALRRQSSSFPAGQYCDRFLLNMLMLCHDVRSLAAKLLPMIKNGIAKYDLRCQWFIRML